MPALPLKVAVVGAGVMGIRHLEKFSQIPKVVISGFWDTEAERRQMITSQHGYHSFSSLSAALENSDAVVIASPTRTHYDIAMAAVEAGKHILIEKPITKTQEEAESLAALVKSKRVVAQVGLVERFRFSVLSSDLYLQEGSYIESQRLATTPGRELDVDVIEDLMIHDLDLILSIVGEDPVNVEALGKSILGTSLDMASVRLEFANGTVAQLTASRISPVGERRFSIYSERGHLFFDFRNNRVNRSVIESKQLSPSESYTDEPLDPLRIQCAHFTECVIQGKVPLVNLYDGVRVLSLCQFLRDKAQGRVSDTAYKGMPSWQPGLIGQGHEV